MTARSLGVFMVNAEIFPLCSQYARTPATLTKRSALLRLAPARRISNGKSPRIYLTAASRLVVTAPLIAGNRRVRVGCSCAVTAASGYSEDGSVSRRPVGLRRRFVSRNAAM